MNFPRRLLITAVIALQVMAAMAIGRGFGSDLSSTEGVLRQHLDSLSQATTASDSIDIIYGMFDMLPPDRRPAMGHELYRLVRSEEGIEGALGVLRLLTMIYKDNPEALNAIIHEMSTMPESDELQESILFARIYLAANQARGESPESLREKITALITSDSNHISDHYDRLLHLFTVCMYVREMTHGPLLAENLRYLDRELHHRPLSTYAIRRQYADMKAQIFTENDEAADAVDADRELLAVINGMDSDYRSRERKHMALHWFRYRAYTRMLRNFNAISDQEARQYYAELNALADSLPEVRAVYNSLHYPDIFYLLKIGDDAAALPLLKKALATETNISRRRFLLRQLIDAARHTGDDALALAAVTEYNPLLEDFIQQKIKESEQEITVSHNLASVHKQALENELEMRRERGHRRNIAIICSAIALAVALAALIQLMIMINRCRHTESQLRKTNSHLTQRHNILRNSTDEMLQAVNEAEKAQHDKTTFIKYISSTISLPLSSIMEYAYKIIDAPDQDATSRRILQRFAEVIEDNSAHLRKSARHLKALAHGEEFQQKESNDTFRPNFDR